MKYNPIPSFRNLLYTTEWEKNRENKVKIENRSFKADYFCKSMQKNEQFFFIELKTEMGSRNQKQDCYLKASCQTGLNALINGIGILSQKTNQPKKYQFLIEKLTELGLNSVSSHCSLNVIYIQPKNSENKDNVISFNDIVISLQNENDDILAGRFIKSLRDWANNKA